MTSVNYNASATAALRTLQQTNSQLDAVQNRVSTGFKIGEAKDNAAYWSISTTLKSDNKSLATVKDALGLGAATVDVAYEGLNSAKDVLDEIKSKLTAATQDGVDRSKIQSEIAELQKQLKSIADSSIFSGENWLSVDSSSAAYIGTKSVVASFSRDAQGAVSVGTINVDTTSVKLFDASATATGIIDSGVTLKKADGTVLTVGGTNASGAAPALQGLGTVSASAGTNVGSASAAIANLGTLNLVGLDVTDRISFNLTVDGGTATPVVFSPANVTTPGNFVTELQAAINTAVGAGKVTVAVNGSTNAITLTSAAAAGTSAVTVSGLAAVDGNGVTTGLLGTTLANTPAVGAETTASITNTTTGTYTALTGSDTLQFKVQYGSQTFQATLNATNTAAVTDKATYIAALQSAINAATDLNGGTALGAGKLVVASGAANAVTITTVGTGADEAVGIFDVVDTGASATTFETNSALATINTVSGTSSAAAYTFAAAINTTGVAPGDRIAMDVTFTDGAGSAGTHSSTLYISTAGITTANAAGDIAKFVTNAQAAVDATFGAGKIVVDNNAGALRFTTVGKGALHTITAANLRAVDGNGVSTTTLGMTNGSATGTANTTLAPATATAGAAFVGPAVYDSQDELTFNVAVDGGANTKVTVNRATVDAALGLAANGTINNAGEFATVVNKALQNASLSSTLTASANGSNQLVLTKNTAGAGSIAVSGAASTTGGDTMSIDKIDVTDAALTVLGVTSADRKDVLTAYISVVNEAINKITSAAATLGSVASRIELQQGFVNKLMDTIDKGVSGLVDADMSEESTKLQALQTKQQLGVQALSIANSSAQNILSLFR